MTTTKLAKLYEHLTPRERLPLIMAASRRGDDAELERLKQTSPRMAYRVPDYFGLAGALKSVSLLHLCDRLDLGARFWLVLGLWEMCAAGDSPADRKLLKRLEGSVGAMALRFCVEVDGWQRFCAGLDIAPDALLAELPAFATTAQMEKLARPMTSTPEEAAAYVRKNRTSGSIEFPTVDEVAGYYRELLAAAQQIWE